MSELLKQLEQDLKTHSHSSDALEVLQNFVKPFASKERQVLFNTPGALVRRPIRYDQALEKGWIGPEEDPFSLLQGDIVYTDAAYFMGERITGPARFMVATPTCDLIPGRRRFIGLLRVQSLPSSDPSARNTVGLLLKFGSTKGMYLPPLPGDDSGVLANAVSFDGMAQVESADLQLSTRVASLSLVGWRIFGSLLRNVVARAGINEVAMRTSFDQEA